MSSTRCMDRGKDTVDTVCCGGATDVFSVVREQMALIATIDFGVPSKQRFHDQRSRGDTVSETAQQHAVGRSHCHQALFYAGEDELIASISRFVRGALAEGDKVLIMLSRAKLERLSAALGADGSQVRLADMDTVGANPARIMPLWRSFLDGLAPNQRGRAVGEPVTTARTPAELAECQVYESLLNLAFAEAPHFLLLCPYDTAQLGESVLDEARRRHAFIANPGHSSVSSPAYVPEVILGALTREDLSPRPKKSPGLTVTHNSVNSAREKARAYALQHGLLDAAAEDVALAVHEVVVNSLLHGAGRGRLSMWTEGDDLIFEVRDSGHFEEPLAGHLQPAFTSENGRGLWLANQLCDLVQVRSTSGGTVVRLHVRARRKLPSR